MDLMRSLWNRSTLYKIWEQFYSVIFRPMGAATWSTECELHDAVFYSGSKVLRQWDMYPYYSLSVFKCSKSLGHVISIPATAAAGKQKVQKTRIFDCFLCFRRFLFIIVTGFFSVFIHRKGLIFFSEVPQILFARKYFLTLQIAGWVLGRCRDGKWLFAQKHNW